MPRLFKIFLYLYPLVAHIAILSDQASWAVMYLALVAYLNSVALVARYRFGVLVSAFLFSGLFFALIFYAQLGHWGVFLPPILIPAWLAFVFISSLFAKRALITQIAERVEAEPLSARQVQYTRILTGLWGGVFLLMIVEAVSLALWAPFDVWSWWVHVGNYAVVLGLFILELIARRLILGRGASVSKTVRAYMQRNEGEP